MNNYFLHRNSKEKNNYFFIKTYWEQQINKQLTTQATNILVDMKKSQNTFSCPDEDCIFTGKHDCLDSKIKKQV